MRSKVSLTRTITRRLRAAGGEADPLACGYKPANDGIDTQFAAGLPRAPLNQFHDALRRACAGPV